MSNSIPLGLFSGEPISIPMKTNEDKKSRHSANLKRNISGDRGGSSKPAAQMENLRRQEKVCQPEEDNYDNSMSKVGGTGLTARTSSHDNRQKSVSETFSSDQRLSGKVADDEYLETREESKQFSWHIFNDFKVKVMIKPETKRLCRGLQPEESTSNGMPANTDYTNQFPDVVDGMPKHSSDASLDKSGCISDEYISNSISRAAPGQLDKTIQGMPTQLDSLNIKTTHDLRKCEPDNLETNQVSPEQAGVSDSWYFTMDNFEQNTPKWRSVRPCDDEMAPKCQGGEGNTYDTAEEQIAIERIKRYLLEDAPA